MAGPDRERDPRVVYADIIDLPHWDSPKHPRMSPSERAAQFSPYAALVGYSDMVDDMVKEAEAEDREHGMTGEDWEETDI